MSGCRCARFRQHPTASVCRPPDTIIFHDLYNKWIPNLHLVALRALLRCYVHMDVVTFAGFADFAAAVEEGLTSNAVVQWCLQIFDDLFDVALL